MSASVCKSCGNAGSRIDTPGSVAVELVLWLCFIVPGLIYSLWRRSAQRDVCDRCGSPDIVPLDTPIGRKLATDYKIHDESAPRPIDRNSVAYKLGKALARKRK